MKCTAYFLGLFAAISVVHAAGEVGARDLDFMVPREYDSNPIDNNLRRRGDARPKPSGKPNTGHDKGHDKGNTGKDKGKGNNEDEECDDDKKAYNWRYTKGKQWWKKDSGEEVEKRDLKDEQFVINKAEDSTSHPVYSKTVVVLVPTYTRHIPGPTKIKDGTETLTFPSPTVFTFTKGPYTRTKQVLSCHTTTTEYDVEEGCAECSGWPYWNRE